MPENGYDINEIDPRLEDKNYAEKFEDNTELTRRLKNFVEGYWEALRHIQIRVWLMKHNDEYNKEATEHYQQMVVK